MTWARSTSILSTAEWSADVEAAFARSAEGMGLAWPVPVELTWRTVGTTEVGRLRKRTRTVVTTGLLGPDVLAWAVEDDGGAPGAVVVRRSRVDVSDGSAVVAGLTPELRARAGDLDTDGVSVRGDLGGRDLATAFIGLGTGTDADRVRAALLATT